MRPEQQVSWNISHIPPRKRAPGKESSNNVTPNMTIVCDRRTALNTLKLNASWCLGNGGFTKIRDPESRPGIVGFPYKKDPRRYPYFRKP